MCMVMMLVVVLMVFIMMMMMLVNDDADDDDNDDVDDNNKFPIHFRDNGEHRAKNDGTKAKESCGTEERNSRKTSIQGTA